MLLRVTFPESLRYFLTDLAVHANVFKPGSTNILEDFNCYSNIVVKIASIPPPPFPGCSCKINIHIWTNNHVWQSIVSTAPSINWCAIYRSVDRAVLSTDGAQSTWSSKTRSIVNSAERWKTIPQVGLNEHYISIVLVLSICVYVSCVRVSDWLLMILLPFI